MSTLTRTHRPKQNNTDSILVTQEAGERSKFETQSGILIGSAIIQPAPDVEAIPASAPPAAAGTSLRIPTNTRTTTGLTPLADEDALSHDLDEAQAAEPDDEGPIEGPSEILGPAQHRDRARRSDQIEFFETASSTQRVGLHPIGTDADDHALPDRYSISLGVT
jgi:hypothetical protein